MNKDFIIGAILVTLIVASVFSISEINAKYSHASYIYETAVVTQVTRADGTVEPPVDQGSNLVTDIGYNFTVSKLFGVTPGNGLAAGSATVIALGNGTGSVETNTMRFLNNSGAAATMNQAIPDCSLTPATSGSTNIVSSTGNTSMTYQWTMTSPCASEVVNQTALYNQTANNSALLMFAGKNFGSSVTLQVGDQLNVTWYVWPTST